MKIGFIGTGIMGSRMAANLQKHGYELVVHNRTKAKAEPLLQKGAVWAETPAEVARQTSVFFTILPYPQDIARAAEGEGGFLEGLTEGTVWVDCSTVYPAFSQEMARKTLARKGRFLDAPIAGSKIPAEEGKLRFFVGGEEVDYLACKPYFLAMGTEALHIGGYGMGSTMKMILNLIIGEAMLAFGEALVLGEAMGLSRERLLELILTSHVAAPFLNTKRAKLESNTYEADFPLKLMEKDLQIATTTAYEKGVALPAAGAAKEIYALAARHGLAEMDYSAIYSFLSRGQPPVKWK